MHTRAQAFGVERNMADGNQSLSAFWRAYGRVVLACAAVQLLPEHARLVYLDPLTREIVRFAYLLRHVARVNMYYLRRKLLRMRIVRQPPLLVTSNSRLCSMPRISCRLQGGTEIIMMQPLSSLVLYRICRKIPKPCSGRLGMPA